MAAFTSLVKGIIGALGINVDLKNNPEDSGGPSFQLDAEGGYAYELVPLNPSCIRLSRRSLATFAS